MMPAASTLRIRWLSESAIHTVPAPSMPTPRLKLSMALVAGPPSPENPALPVPAKVEIVPDGSMRRIRLTFGS